jgi:hypothetical protein
MNSEFNNTPEAIKERGEVFTPGSLVDEILDEIPRELFTNKDQLFLDSSCGNGQFLSAVLKRKIQNGIAHKDALSSIYGVELDPKNAEECRQRLLGTSKSKELRAIVDHNIICADALDPNHDGWSEVGFYWEPPIEANWYDWSGVPKRKKA